MTIACNWMIDNAFHRDRFQQLLQGIPVRVTLHLHFAFEPPEPDETARAQTNPLPVSYADCSNR